MSTWGTVYFVRFLCQTRKKRRSLLSLKGIKRQIMIVIQIDANICLNKHCYSPESSLQKQLLQISAVLTELRRSIQLKILIKEYTSPNLKKILQHSGKIAWLRFVKVVLQEDSGEKHCLLKKILASI